MLEALSGDLGRRFGVDYRSHRAARPVVITCWAAAVTLMLGGSWRGGRERRVGHGDPALHPARLPGRGLSGAIDLASVATVRRTLLKDLSEQPDALICDLAGVERLDPTAAAVFSTVAKHPASRWPTTSFLLCGARPQVAEALRRVRASQLVRMYVTVEEAVEAARARPPSLRDELRLAPVPTAARAARAFVREVCRAWRLDAPGTTVVDRAVLVANELVTNAVIHAHTDLWLRRADRLFIAVRDRGPKVLQPVPPDPEAEGGRGLWLVEQLGRAWGSAPLPTAARPSGAPSPSDLLPPSPPRSRRRRDLGP